MLKKKYRLPSSIKLGKANTKYFRHFVLKTADNSLPNPRFAFVISKKVDSRAVVRNKIKREMTSSIQNIISKISAGKDMIFIFKGKSESIKDLQSEIEKALLGEVK